MNSPGLRLAFPPSHSRARAPTRTIRRLQVRLLSDAVLPALADAERTFLDVLRNISVTTYQPVGRVEAATLISSSCGRSLLGK